MTPLESMIKECMEEASLPEDLVAPLIKPTGAVSYCYRYLSHFPIIAGLRASFTSRTIKGWLQPEVQYVSRSKMRLTSLLK